MESGRRRADRMFAIACCRFALPLLAAGLIPAVALAGPNSDARLAIHLAPRTTKNACARVEATPSCGGVVTNGGLYPSLYYAYLLIMKGNAVNGLAGLQCGIQYDGGAGSGIDVFGWTLCATLDFPSGGWPAAGSGNLVTWDAASRCQRGEPGGPGTGVTATAGYFYVASYSPDVLQITTRPVDDRAKVADCQSNEDVVEGGTIHHDPPFLGSASFTSGGSTPGYNPCSAPTRVIDCSIAGPATVLPGATISYSAPNAPPEASFLWSISGNGTIVGSQTNPSVTIEASVFDGGSFDLSVTVGTTSGESTCSRRIFIQAPPQPSCTIGGADPVVEGASGQTFQVGANYPIQSVVWSIAGNGTITSGPTSTLITVQVGEVGAFQLTANVTLTSGTQISCSRTITVIALTCGITGPDPVPASTAGLAYAAAQPVPGSTYLWQISGNGVIVGSAANPQVLVNSGTTGAFTLSLTQTRSAVAHNCSRTITITAGPPPPHANANAKLLIHLTSPTTKNACGSRGAPTCGQVNNAGALAPTQYFAYLVVMDGNAVAGIGGVQCGIDYDAAAGAGVDIFSWTLCGSLEFPSGGTNGPWPAAGSGDLITWDTAHCQRTEPGGSGAGVSAAAGYFYLSAYSPDVLQIIPRPVDGQAKVADCHASEDLIGGTGFPPGVSSRLGSARFTASGQIPGYNPCGIPVNVQPTTWSHIKGLYGK